MDRPDLEYRYASHAGQHDEWQRRCGQDPLEDHLDQLIHALDAECVHLPMRPPTRGWARRQTELWETAA